MGLCDDCPTSHAVSSHRTCADLPYLSMGDFRSAKSEHALAAASFYPAMLSVFLCMTTLPLADLLWAARRSQHCRAIPAQSSTVQYSAVCAAIPPVRRRR